MTRQARTFGGAFGAHVVLAVVTACAAAANGAAPIVDYLFPAGGQQGTSVAVTAGGKFDKAPLQVWTDHPGLKAQPAAAGGTFTLQIDKAVPPGPRLLRLYNGEGSSALRVFMIGTDKESPEAEPNDEVSQAQVIEAPPATINGRLEKSGDVDSCSVTLETGQWLTASLQCRRLGSPLDPMLHLHDAAGNQVAFAHDGLGLDPVLAYRAERAGKYVVRVSAFAHPPAADVKLAGGPSAVYRLNVSTTPAVRYAYPAGVRRGTKGALQLFDFGGGALAREADATGLDAAADALALPAAGCDGLLRVDVGEGPELTESEARNASASQAPQAPFAVTGRIERAGEMDAFQFSGKKGRRVILAARAVAIASAMDPALRVEDESGKQLASDDDGGGGPPGSDARLEWDPPADGVYRAVVSDLYGDGGEGHVYRLALRTPVPSVSAAVDAEEYRITPGKTVPVKVTIARRDGHAGAMVAVVTGLHTGVTATSAEVPEKGGEVVLTLSAAADAKPAGGLVRVMLLGADPKHPAAIPAFANLKKDAGQELVAKTPDLWLTVLPRASEPPATTKPKECSREPGPACHVCRDEGCSISNASRPLFPLSCPRAVGALCARGPRSRRSLGGM